MNESELHTFFTQTKKYGALWRAFAGLISLGCVLVFSTSVVALATNLSLNASSVEIIAAAGLSALVLWPLSYVAIRGVAPKTWHPYT